MEMVLILTTAGPTSFAIWVKVVDRVTGLGTCNGFASELSTFDSFPSTPWAMTDPIKMPADNVARIAKVKVKRRIRSLSIQAFIVFNRTSWRWGMGMVVDNATL